MQMNPELLTPVAATSNAAPDPVAVAESSRRLIELARRVAASSCTVLISGESGTGKEVLARFIHRQSHRSMQPFVAVNCAAIPETMLEALLFGYERGAFTGAHAAHCGKFEQAQGGTLLLDEISEIPLGLQAKLLRVLQEREVEKLGGRGTVALDVRVLATTNRVLRQAVAEGRFREDLYYRLNVFPIVVTPLRQRREDILPIAMQMLASRIAPGSTIPPLSAAAAQLLLTHRWPGNARELDNVLQRALVLCDGAMIEAQDIEIESEELPTRRDATLQPEPATPLAATPRGALARTLKRVEQDVLMEALRKPQWNREAVATHLGISPRTLRHKLARLRAAGVDVPAGGP
jgi:two-component system response regulator FlrC